MQDLGVVVAQGLGGLVAAQGLGGLVAAQGLDGLVAAQGLDGLVAVQGLEVVVAQGLEVVVAQGRDGLVAEQGLEVVVAQGLEVVVAQGLDGLVAVQGWEVALFNALISKATAVVKFETAFESQAQQTHGQTDTRMSTMLFSEINFAGVLRLSAARTIQKFARQKFARQKFARAKTATQMENIPAPLNNAPKIVSRRGLGPALIVLK